MCADRGGTTVLAKEKTQRDERRAGATEVRTEELDTAAGHEEREHETDGGDGRQAQVPNDGQKHEDNRATGEHASLDAAPQTTHRNGDAHDVDGVCRRRDRGEISHRSETRTDREDGQQQIDQEQDDEVGGGNRSLQKHEDSDVDRYREHAGENDDAESCWNAPRKTREKVLRGRG